MTMLSNVWARGIVSAQRIFEILETVPQISDVPNALVLPDQIQGRIIFEKVAFYYYRDDGREILTGLNLVIEPGKTVAVLGATGAGKSTMINLVPRLYDVSSGRILIDGIDIRQIKQDSLLSQIGMVPQESILFSGTVRDNIRYGRLEAGEEEVIAPAKTAQGHWRPKPEKPSPLSGLPGPAKPPLSTC